MENLKPCPLCGGKAINRVVEKTTVSDYYGIVCVKCNCRTAGYLDFNKAIKAWNRRAYDPDKIVAELEKLADKANDKILEDAALRLYYDGYEDAMRTAVEIVKGGGVDGN